ncbi:MAG: histidinol-phosphatase HisJ family protein [Bacillota bacterium]|nr:histidinol-phosphatase HisJ family protein [Bacillota bacterium]
MKIYTDHHVHTEYSPDSSGDMEKYILRAKMLKQDEIMFTDHIDIGSPDEMFKKLIDYDQYFQQVSELKKKYDIDIKVGVEMGYQKNFHYEIEDFVKRYPFDFVIASIHFGEGMDFYSGDFFRGKTQKEAYFRYFEIVEDMVDNFNDFDVVGHLDYITRYGDFTDKKYDYEEFSEIIDRILSKIIEKGKGIEINTSGLRNELQVFHPKREVVQRYLQLGGKVITIGSDAHFVDDYSAGINEAMELLKKLGIKKINTFEKRISGKYSLV